MSEDNYKSLSNLINDVYQTIFDHTHWQSILHQLSKGVHNGKASITKRNNASGLIDISDPIFTKAYGFSESDIERYLKLYSNNNNVNHHWVDIEKNYKLGELCIYEKHLPLKDLVKTEFYNVDLKPQGLSGAVSLQIFKNKEYRIVLTILHNEEKGSANLTKLHEKLELLSPHFCQSISLWMLLSQEKEYKYSNTERSDYLNKRYDLTQREGEIIVALVRLSNLRKIADSLFISENTVKSHVKSIKKKMGVKTNHEMMLRLFSVMDSGITPKKN